jgi:glycosyltransferase involved in cell wall biosynthesis
MENAKKIHTMKVSIVIPTYNAGRKIVRALNSVINQSAWMEDFPEPASFEILICDDGSTDNTLHLAKMYPHVRILASEHNTGGPNAGRNRGIQAATGDVIAFLDQDDEWLPDKIEKQLEQIKQGYEFVYSPCRKELE